MSLRFTVLASGSSGNASLLEVGPFGLLIDAGLGPRQLDARLQSVGASWTRIQALILTHPHADHWNDRTAARLQRHGISLYCHPEHHGFLHSRSSVLAGLQQVDLVRTFEPGQELLLAPNLRCRPLKLNHDGGGSYGFRFEGAPNLFGESWSLAYLTDLGCWDDDLAQALVDVDLLALEFNHDVNLEYASGRTAHLIARVLGDQGHLSNDQAARLLAEVLRQSTPGRLRHLVQLHLSPECNRPDLAAQAARSVLDTLGISVAIHTAGPSQAGPCVPLGIPARLPRPRQVRRRGAGSPLAQAWLPGLGPP
jgi:phosphoribosyl 1,2-cyclic phosphodiesterase